jgi:16S rRNA (cytosine967-C5)-methyltransferase
MLAQSMNLEPPPADRRTPDARDIATERIVRQAKRFPEVDLAPLDAGELAERDAALARAIDHAVARHWLTLAWLLQGCLDREWSRVQPEIQGALLVAAAQMIYLDRVPAYAAVDHAVSWTKRRVRPKAGGLVNAVLRRLALRRDGATRQPRPEGGVPPDHPPTHLPLPDGSALVFAEPVFPHDPMARLGLQTGHARALVARWAARFGEGEARSIALHGLIHPPIIVSAANDEIASNPLLGAHARAGFAVFGGTHDQLSRWLDEPGRGEARRVQDPASAEAATLTAGSSPRLIIDVCAGLGTKTHQLAAMHPQARLIASDADESRLAVLRRRFAGSERVLVAERSSLSRWNGAGDVVVLDVPCSNTGVLARRPEARYRFDEARLESLIGLQRQIVADSLLLRALGGRILYSTCSLEPEENEKMVEWMERWHPLRRRSMRSSTPAGRPGDEPSTYADGAFAALLAAA